MNKWQVLLQQSNLRINIDKTKVMPTESETHGINVLINYQRLEQADTFKYLGVEICKNGSIEHELNDQITNAANIYHIQRKQFLKRHRISKNTNMTVY